MDADTKQALDELRDLVERLTYREEGQAAAVERLLSILYSALPSSEVDRLLNADPQIQMALQRPAATQEVVQPIPPEVAYDGVIKLVLSRAAMLREQRGC